jgi:hypothetical protein
MDEQKRMAVIGALLLSGALVTGCSAKAKPPAPAPTPLCYTQTTATPPPCCVTGQNPCTGTPGGTCPHCIVVPGTN